MSNLSEEEQVPELSRDLSTNPFDDDSVDSSYDQDSPRVKSPSLHLGLSQSPRRVLVHEDLSRSFSSKSPIHGIDVVYNDVTDGVTNADMLEGLLGLQCTSPSSVPVLSVSSSQHTHSQPDSTSSATVSRLLSVPFVPETWSFEDGLPAPPLDSSGLSLPPKPLHTPSPHIVSLDVMDVSALHSHMCDAVRLHSAWLELDAMVAQVETQQWRQYLQEMETYNTLATHTHDSYSELLSRETVSLQLISAPLSCASTELNTQIATLSAEVDLLTQRLDHVQTVATSQKQDRLIRHTHTDISSLPKAVIRQIVAFLKPRDIFSCLLVCRRWRYVFDQGYVWKQCMRVHVINLRLKFNALNADHGPRVALTPPELIQVRIPITKVKPLLAKRKVLPQDEVFVLALSHEQSLAAQAQSEREDLSSRSSAEKNVAEFLEQQLRSLRFMYGKLLVERDRLEHHFSALAQQKSTLVTDTVVLEESIKAEEQRRATIVEKHKAILRAVDRQISTVRDIDNDEGTMSDVVNTLKQEKKALVRAVKQMRADVQDVTGVNEVLLRRLREAGIEPPSKPTQ